MAYLDEWDARGIPQIDAYIVSNVREDLRRFFWSWYEDHKDDTIASLRVLFFTIVSVKVKDIRYLFEKLFGEPI